MSFSSNLYYCEHRVSNGNEEIILLFLVPFASFSSLYARHIAGTKSLDFRISQWRKEILTSRNDTSQRGCSLKQLFFSFRLEKLRIATSSTSWLSYCRFRERRQACNNGDWIMRMFVDGYNCFTASHIAAVSCSIVKFYCSEILILSATHCFEPRKKFAMWTSSSFASFYCFVSVKPLFWSLLKLIIRLNVGA